VNFPTHHNSAQFQRNSALKMISVYKWIPKSTHESSPNFNVIVRTEPFIQYLKKLKTNNWKQRINQNSFNLCCPTSKAARCHAYSYDLQVQWQFQTRHRRHNRYNPYQLLLLLLIPYTNHIGRTSIGLWHCADLNFENQETVRCICRRQNDHHPVSD
jgi:hypothetical protein